MTPVTLDEAIALLNDALRLDRDAVERLFFFRTPCNEALGEHPTIQVAAPPLDAERSIGILGLLNGMFGIDEKGWGALCYVKGDDGHIEEFRRTPQFTAPAPHNDHLREPCI